MYDYVKVRQGEIYLLYIYLILSIFSFLFFFPRLISVKIVILIKVLCLPEKNSMIKIFYLSVQKYYNYLLVMILAFPLNIYPFS